MADERYPVTPEGLEKLKTELEQLEHVDRKATVNAVAEARAHGDLSENAEYHAAREKLRLIDRRIAELASKVANAEVVDVAAQSGETVRFGASVRIYDEEGDTEREYTILGEEEADAQTGILSVHSPLARALLGARVGDEIEMAGGSGVRHYEVLELWFGPKPKDQ